MTQPPATPLARILAYTPAVGPCVEVPARAAHAIRSGRALRRRVRRAGEPRSIVTKLIGTDGVGRCVVSSAPACRVSSCWF